MKSVSMLEFRQHARDIVERVRSGQSIVLTYRGKPMARIEPLEPSVSGEDPFYALADLADEDGLSLTNDDIDEALYGG